MTVKTVGLDLAKDVFQVHGISESGRVIFNKAIKRAKLLAFFEALSPCTIGMEACGSSHHWGRTLRKLGHDVRLRSGQTRRLLQRLDSFGALLSDTLYWRAS